MTATKAQIQTAITKSNHLHGASRVRWLGGRRYTVDGEHGVYTVDVNGDNWRCTCPAGANGRVCWHLAAVWSRRLGQEAMVRGAGKEVTA